MTERDGEERSDRYLSICHTFCCIRCGWTVGDSLADFQTMDHIISISILEYTGIGGDHVQRLTTPRYQVSPHKHAYSI